MQGKQLSLQITGFIFLSLGDIQKISECQLYATFFFFYATLYLSSRCWQQSGDQATVPAHMELIV